jgi:hypothetical protein
MDPGSRGLRPLGRDDNACQRIAPQRESKLPVGTVGAAPVIRLEPLALDWRAGVGAGAACAVCAGSGACAAGFGWAAVAGADCGRTAGFGVGVDVAALAAGGDGGLLSSLPNKRPADANRPENIPPDSDDARGGGGGAAFESPAAVM